ncbi:MAG TPA: hypothetical protein VNA17_07885 [Pyrinomonadaceae bacterium]|nr:hypothetical protein [Pyrinomonadaceae bacterium]
MALKKCEKCSEMVPEAKAFCPACGHAFVDEERRREKSKFDKMESTVQLGQTMFGNMLSDLGLNIAKSPGTPEKRVEVIAPAAEAAKPEEAAATAKPAAESPKQSSPPAVATGPDGPANPAASNRWVAIGGILAIVIWLLILIVAFVMFVYLPRSGAL